MRFIRSGCISRHVLSDEVGGQSLISAKDRRKGTHATPLDFTTREVARETFRWRVPSLPLLVQIAFRVLNLFRELGRRSSARARSRRWNFCLAFSYRLFSLDIQSALPHSRQVRTWCIARKDEFEEVNACFSSSRELFQNRKIILFFIFIVERIKYKNINSTTQRLSITRIWNNV